MLIYITIGILFAYTVILIGFFMGWCTLIPNKCHPRRSVPFSSVRSPRRNTKFVEIDSVSSSHSAESIKRILPERVARKLRKKHSLSITPPRRPDDYLHPKYSLPPIAIDIEKRWEFERIMRDKLKRAASLTVRKQESVTSIEEETDVEMNAVYEQATARDDEISDASKSPAIILV